jgi:RHS repeat-associated protein
MKIVVIFIVLLIITIPVSSAKEVSIPELFEIENQVDINPLVKEVYFYAGSKLIAVNDEYQYQDHLGSDINSKSLPFGQSLNKGGRFIFTGKELDKDLYYFNARYYDSNLGKFTSVDPVRDNHAYSYVNNNPMNFVDPTGMDYKGEAGDLGAQLEYFDNTLTQNLRRGDVNRREIDEIRSLVQSGEMLILPGSISSGGGTYFPEGGRMVYQNSYDHVDEDTGKSRSVVSYSSVNMAQYGDIGPFQNIKSEPIAEARIIIEAVSINDAFIAGSVLHEYQHIINSQRGVINRVEDEYISFRRQGNFLKESIGRIPLEWDLAYVARTEGIEIFYEASNSIYRWDEKGIRLPQRLKNKYPGPNSFQRFWRKVFD